VNLYHIRPVLDEITLPLLNRFKYLSLSLRPNDPISAEVVDVMPSGRAILRIKGSDVEVRTQIPLKKDMQLKIQVLPPKGGEKDIRVQILSAVKADKKEKITLNKQSALSDLLIMALQNKNRTKSFVIKNFKTVQNIVFEDIENLFSQLKAQNDPAEKEAVLSRIKELTKPFFLEPSKEDFSIRIKDLFENGGFALSSKMKKISKRSEELALELHPDKRRGLKLLKELLQDSSKAEGGIKQSLEQLKLEIDEVKKDHGFLQRFENIIDYSKLLSYLSNGLFVPFFWEFGEANMVIKPLKRGFLCKIHLGFEDIGDVEVDAFAVDEDLLVDFYASPIFLEALKEGMDEIREEIPFKNIFFRFYEGKKEPLDFVKEMFQESLVDVKI